MDFDRDPGSHVREDGRAKRTYPTREDAAVAADALWLATGSPRNPYKCNQQPEHWHVGRGIADLEPRR